MVKAYLRYEHSGSFGVIAGAGALAYDPRTSLLAAAALEDVSIRNVKQASLVRKLTSAPTAAGRAASEVTQLAASPAVNLLAAGYSDGTVRLWNVETGECDVTLSGHKTAVTALRFSASGAQLASGAQDTDIVVWDVVAQAGLFRLRGHHGQITGLAWLEAGGRLVSCAKDGYVKVWELAMQHCSQTIVGHRGEVWGLDVDAAEQRLATGSADADLRLYSIHASDSSGASTSYETLKPLGAVRRSAPERAAAVAWGGAGGRLLAVQSAGRAVELFRVRSEAEARKHMKRRRKRRREKAIKAGEVSAVTSAAEEAAAAAEDEVITAADELEPFQVVRSKHKVRAFVFSPTAKRGALAQLTLSLANNSIEVWDVAEDGVARGAVIEAAGHRSDVRAVALSSDDASLLSASSAAVKVWNPRTGACTATVDTGYGLSLLWAPGNRHAIVGTKEGTLDIVDIGAAERTEAVPAHAGPVWSLAALPDSSGFVSGSADHELRFWEWQLTASAPEADSRDGAPARRLGIRHTRTLKMTDDVLCVRISPNGKLLAVSLLDCTVKVFFLDSLKFFLSLYGHKLPVLSMDISSDSTLLASGSADKNLKIWGLDFGDCHRSLFAHGDSLMAVAFQPNTHYVFTAGKDKLVKYWDADKFEQLLELPAHHGPVWGLAVSHLGDMLVSCGGDRAIRRWERTEEPFFVEEEREARLESLFESDLEDADVRRVAKPGQAEAAPDEGSGAPAARRTLASISATDAISDALEAAEAEQRRMADHAAAGDGEKALAPNPLMRGMAGGEYVRSAVASVKPGDLEAALLCLPFADALRLLPRLAEWLATGAQVELGCRVAVLLVRLHRQQLLATPSARRHLLLLHQCLHAQVRGLKDTLGFNLAAMRHLARAHKSATAVMGDDEPEAVRPVKRRRVEPQCTEAAHVL